MTDWKDFVFADPLLPFGTIREANSHCKYLQMAPADPQTKIYKRVKFLPTLEQSYYHSGADTLNNNLFNDFSGIIGNTFSTYSFTVKLFLLISFIFISILTLGQNIQDRDSLGNLWIITFDKSGSMTNYSSIAANARNVINKMPPVYNLMNFKKDRFSFYNTGILTKNDISELRFQEKFEKSFIHENYAYEKLYRLEKFRGSDNLGLYIESKLKISNNNEWNNIYKYRYSFVSLIRPMALSHAINRFYYQNKIGDTINILKQFNQIFVLSITDDADINDQWLTDYKTVEKYAPNKLKEINATLNRLVVSPFNFLAKPIGKFIPIYEKDGNWKIFLHEYNTYASIDDTLINTSYLNIEQINDTSLIVDYSSNIINSLQIEFCQINKCILNNKNIITGKYFSRKDTILINKLLNTEENCLIIQGSFQVSYIDNILGKRSKKIFFKERINFYSNAKILKDRNHKIRYILIISILILILIFWYLFYRPRHILFDVFDNLGNHIVVKRGFPFAINTQFKRAKCLKSINYISSYPINLIKDAGDNNKVVISSNNFLQQKFIEQYSKKQKNGDLIIYLKSREKLDVSSDPKNFTNDFVTEFTNENYEKLTSGGKGNDILKQIINRTNSKAYFYFIPIKQNDTESNLKIEVKSPIEMKKTFVFSFTPIFSTSTNDKLNEKGLNQFYNNLCINKQFEKKLNHNGLITINKIDSDLVWNITALSHNGNSYNSGNPINIYHFYEYKQPIISTIDMSEIKPILEILKNEIKQSSFLKIDNIAVYLNNTGLEHDFFEAKSVSHINNQRVFRITESNYKSFLYLRETKLRNTDSIEKQLYTPFDIEARRKNIYKKTPVEGDYYLFSALIPLEKLNNINGNYSDYITKLSDEVISISHQCDQEVIFQEGKMLFLNHEIKIQ